MFETIWTPLAARAATNPDSVAVLQKRFGLWTATTSRALVARVVATANALREHGVERDDVVALVLAPHEDRVIIDLALQLIGARVVGVPSNTPIPRVRQQLGDAVPVVAVVQGQAAADGILELLDEGALPELRRVYYLDPAGVQEYASTVLAPFPTVDATSVPEPSTAMTALAADLDPNAIAVGTSTSGTFEEPTSVLLSHVNLAAAASATIEAFDMGPGDRVMSFRPLSDPVERGATIYPALLSGATLVLPESRASVGQAMVEIAPTYLHITPRFAEELATNVRLRMQSTTGLKGLVLKSWNKRLRQAVEEGRAPSPSGLSRALVGRHVLGKLGLDQVRWLLVSGTPISPEAVAFYSALGVTLRRAYSMAEVGGFAMATTAGTVGWETAMTPVPGIEAGVEHSELVLRGPSVSDDATTDGWLRTGDSAESVDDGFVVTGRVGDEVPTSGGGSVTAQQVAARLRSSPYIREAVVAVEDGFVVAVVEPTQSTLSRWANAKGLRFTTAKSLFGLPETQELLRRAVDTAAARLDIQLDDVRVLAAPLSVADGTLTGTEKPVWDAVLAAEVVPTGARVDTPTDAAARALK
ncbi:Long-chain-fatty-acid--CoA ligase [Euzebya pacifica]|uniref:Long-chain-fatty-acid--CoA ligase n=1 Tax=Euzebya pacifica TaxID=1608957 RepID=A0A346Y360_9ACTN|nr:AMP-binding protein [Euzebya pacifica]AXV08907.1 Long-chain-fatty-acid--CoA ligase [Euzebya pacifica]